MNNIAKDTLIDQQENRLVATPDGVQLTPQGRQAHLEANELYILAKNDYELHTQRELPIIKNLDRKVARGVFDYEKSVKLWGYLIADVNRKYKLNVGPAGRDIAARRFAIDYIQRETGDIPA